MIEMDEMKMPVTLLRVWRFRQHYSMNFNDEALICCFIDVSLSPARKTAPYEDDRQACNHQECELQTSREHRNQYRVRPQFHKHERKDQYQYEYPEHG